MNDGRAFADVYSGQANGPKDTAVRLLGFTFTHRVRAKYVESTS